MFRLTERATRFVSTSRAFIPPCLWLTNSLDLNPVDCELGDVLRRRVYRIWINSVVHLKQRLVEEWHRFESTTKSSSELFDSGTLDCVRVFVKTVVTLSTRCSLVNNFPMLETSASWYKFVNVCIPETMQEILWKIASCMSVKLYYCSCCREKDI